LASRKSCEDCPVWGALIINKELSKATAKLPHFIANQFAHNVKKLVSENVRCDERY